MVITTTPTTPTVTAIQGVVGMGLVQVFGSYYVALGEDLKAKAWKMVCRKQLLVHKLSTIFCNFFGLHFMDCTHRRNESCRQIRSSTTSKSCV